MRAQVAFDDKIDRAVFTGNMKTSPNRQMIMRQAEQARKHFAKAKAAMKTKRHGPKAMAILRLFPSTLWTKPAKSRLSRLRTMMVNSGVGRHRARTMQVFTFRQRTVV